MLYVTVLILWIETSALLQLSYCQTIITTLFDGKYACPGQEVIFTCITSGSVVVAWISDDYIGSNGRQLEFTSSDSLGARVTSTIDSNTFAELIMKEDGLVTESQLHITVSQEISAATVTCIDVGTGSYSIRFELLSIPDIPQDVSAFKVTQSSGDDCIIVVNWNPPSNANTSLVKQYMIESPSGNHTTTKTATAVALLFHRCVVGADALIKIHAIDCCDRNGASSDNDITELLEVSNNSITTEQSPTTKDQRQDSPQCASAVVGGVLGGIIGLIVVILITLSIALWMVSYRTVGHLSTADKLEETLIRKPRRISIESDHAASSEPEEVACRDISDKKSKKQKKIYLVRSKLIDDHISRQPLLKDAGTRTDPDSVHDSDPDEFETITDAGTDV